MTKKEATLEHCIAQDFMDNAYTIRYDFNTKEFKRFRSQFYTWSILTHDEILALVTRHILNSPIYKSKNSTKLGFIQRVVNHLKNLSTTETNPVPGIMFLDKFFDFYHNEVEERCMEHYSTTRLERCFYREQPMNDKVKFFISSLCNHDKFQIELLRYHFKNILQRNNRDQTAFFYLGPEMTGKEIWI